MANETPNQADNGTAGKSPTSASLRWLLVQLLRIDADFDAFCLDFFPNVKAQFTDGMVRTRKINLLLEHAERSEVLARLGEAYPAEIAAHVGGLRYIEDPTPAYRNEHTRALGEQLRQLYEQKEINTLLGEDPAAIIQSILETRRLLRQGPQLQAGEFLQDGRFRLVRNIGKGGFATVWLAYDRVNQCPVAVKILHGQWTDDAQRVERFYRGARRMAQLHHSGIVRVIEEPQEEHGFHYFVMEHIRGGDLRDAIQRHLLTPTQGLEVIRQVGQALQYAHQHGVIHRDIKPANILLGQDSPRLTDFDLAWAIDTTGGTNTGALGTFLYAAPEMMQDAKEVTPAVDVYSLAMTAVFVLYGDEPIEVVGDRIGFMKGFIRSRRLLTVLCKATEREPKNRFLSVSEFCTALADPELLIQEMDVEESRLPEQVGRAGVSQDKNKSQPLSKTFLNMVIDGYQVIRLLDKDAMSEIYEARHMQIEKRASIKILYHSISKYAHYSQRFINQARAVHQIRHPGLVDYFGFGQLSDNIPYLIMEFLEGETLSSRIEKESGKLSWQDAVQWALQVADPISMAHKVGIIHRNLKPDNIMLISDPIVPGGERVKILDFGFAILSDSLHLEISTDDLDIHTPYLLGTPLYMAPEQARGESDLDGKVDVYGLGCILTEMLIGQPPFDSDSSAGLLLKHVQEVPPNLRSLNRSVPRSVSDVVARMLAKERSARPTMGEVARMLRQIRAA